MMGFPIDLNLLRKNPRLFKESIKKRGGDPSVIDKALELDKRRLQLQRELDRLRHKKNIYARLFGFTKQYLSGKLDEQVVLSKLREVGIEIEKVDESILNKIKKEVTKIDEDIKKTEMIYKDTLNNLIKLLWNLPNLVAEDVPVGSEEKNMPIRFWGIPKVYKRYIEAFREQAERWGWIIVELKKFLEDKRFEKYVKNREKLEELYRILEGKESFKEINFNEVLDFRLLNRDRIIPYTLVNFEPKHHYDLIKDFAIADTDKAGIVAGSRFYFEFKELVLMDLALSIEGITFLIERGYKPVIPPYMLKKKVLDGVITLEDYEDMMYKIDGEDLFLIGTAEHPITALYYNEIFNEGDLPLKIVGWSPCFRKEAGAHGKDTKGIFRVHQFHKVEQYIFCKPEDSEKLHEELIRNAEEFLQRLNIPYRVVLIASKDMGKRNYKQYDIEGWFPGQGKYRELVSGSNVTDWQSRRCNIRYRKKDNKLDFVHTLNCTLVAVQRTLCAIMENFYDQKRDAITVPKLLRKYIPNNTIVR